MTYLLQIIPAATASCGFAIIFQIKPQHLKYIALGGVLSWGSYLLFLQLLGHHMKGMFVAAMAVALDSELCARIDKVPSTLIYIPTIIPLIPGSYLYYCTGGLISGNNQEFQKYATLLMEDALAIVLGTILIYTVVSLLNSRYHRHYNVK